MCHLLCTHNLVKLVSDADALKMLQCQLKRCRRGNRRFQSPLMQKSQYFINTGLFLQSVLFQPLCHQTASDLPYRKVVKTCAKDVLHHLCRKLCITAAKHQRMFSSEIKARHACCLTPCCIVMLFRINEYSVHIKYYCLDLIAPHLLQPLFLFIMIKLFPNPQTVSFFIHACVSLCLHGIENSAESCLRT